MTFSILTEFVENENESVSKQDCEINAAKRLMKKLKYKFRKLNICILGDSLYACEPIYKLCAEYNWKFIFRFKEGRARTLWEEIQTIKNIENEGFNNQKNIRYDIEHACCLDYQAMKNHYLMVQIADILRQLLENTSKIIKELKVGIKEISSKMLESFRRDLLTSEDISLLNQHIKIHDL